VLVLKENLHKPEQFQYTIHYEGKSFCPWTQKGFTSYYMHFHLFKYVVKKIFSVSHFTSIFCALAPLSTVYISKSVITDQAPSQIFNVLCIVSIYLVQ